MEKFKAGAIAALMDEYQKASDQLLNLLPTIDQNAYTEVVDPYTSDPDCRSIQTIMGHVIHSGYHYVDRINEHLGRKTMQVAKISPFDVNEAIGKLNTMVKYTKEQMELNESLSETQLNAPFYTDRDGLIFSIDTFLEHAVMHILRHRRQIEKFLWQQKNKS